MRRSTLNPTQILEILEILNLAQKERMIQDTYKLRDLTKNMPIFESLKKSGQPDVHLQLCYELGTKSFRENEVIMNVVLSGKVGVYIRQKRKGQVQKEEQLYLVKILKPGDWFGDVSMVYNQGSLVSFVGLEETHTATVDYKKFKTLLDQFFLIRMTFQINFLREIPLFWDWSENDLRVLYQVYQRQKFVQEEPVYLQGDKSQYIYIAKEGQFRIFKHFDELRIRKYYDKKFRQLLDQDKTHIKPIREFEEEKNLQVGTIQKNEMFGEEDILTKRDRKYSVVCESDYGELFIFTKSAMSCLIMNNEKSKNYIQARLKNKQNSYTKRLDNISQYVSSVKIDVIEKNQDQVRLTEDFLTTRASKILDQQSMIQSMKTLSKLSDTKYGTLRASSVLRNSIRLDLPLVNSQLQQSGYNPRGTRSNFTSSKGMLDNKGYNNFEDRNSMIVSKTQVNFKSLNNLNYNGNLVDTQYFSNQSQFNQNMQDMGKSKAEIQQEYKRKNYMQKYYNQFKFNVVDQNYRDKIVEQCRDLTKEYSQNKIYAKGGFNNRRGQVGYRCLGVDDPIDVESEFQKSKLRLQEVGLDQDTKLNSLNSINAQKNENTD